MFDEETTKAGVRIEMFQFIAIAEVDQDRMATFPFEIGLDELGAAAPTLNQESDRFRLNGRMVSRRNQHRARVSSERANAECNRIANFAVGIRIGDERN